MLRGPIETVISPILACAMGPNGNFNEWNIWVVNPTTQYTLPGGTQVQWTTLNGLSGVATVGPGGLAPGGLLLVGTSPAPWSCSANVV